ncbi:anti-anti-sigma factor [Legionella busanensis]|uniref:Anti-anti-sigma factor n=1 Tax=Legionella busanensis TaxID=190655 RepID=A0A378JIM1_9GAMM|nr:STAS domain-containing protein [Legionella busanensis]STX51156.1 anti-anti-sigma factor [Legionella busanensis]
MADSSFKASKCLTFSVIETERKRLLNYCRANKGLTLTINLEEVSLCDSAGLAFLIEFKRLARKYKKQSNLEGMRESILALAEFCGVADMLADEGRLAEGP